MAIGARPLVPSRLAPGGIGQGARRAATTTIGAYIALTKPRIIELLLITTIPAMVLAEGGWPSTGLVLATLVGGTFAAGGANTINMYVDRDIDRLMPRTRHRPLVQGLVTPRAALIFAVGLEIAAAAVLWTFANLLAAVLALSGMAIYVFVYTLWLKRRSTRNIVIGGSAGAVPALVGWAAVTGSLSWAPVVLFAVIFFWTPPHFWALAIRYADDYRAAGVPMLPAVAPARVAARRMVAYTAVMVATSLLLPLAGGVGWIYTITAVIAGGVFLGVTARLVRRPEPKMAMRVFAFSISYVTLVFGAVMVDVFVRHGL